MAKILFVHDTFFLHLHDLFDLGVLVPSAIPLIERLIRLPSDSAFRAVKVATLGYKTLRRVDIGIVNAARMGWRMRTILKPEGAVEWD